MTRVLVTGGAGAIGSHVVLQLLDAGTEVVLIDDLSSGHREDVDPRAELLVGSIVDDDALAAAFEGATHVVHLAALFANQNSVEHPELDLQVNGLGTLKVLERARRSAITKVVVASSSCVYRPTALAIEDGPVGSEDTPYAITKMLSESYARFFARHHGLNVAIVRPFNVYGPHERPGQYRNVIPNFFALAARGEPLPITGTGAETRDFTYVEDAARGIIGALQGPTRAGDAFNIGSGRVITIRELADLVNEVAESGGGSVLTPSRTWDSTPHRAASIERACNVFGYHPTVELRDGLVRTYEWLKPRLV